MSWPAYSAYVPCRDNAATLRRAVESVLRQVPAPAEVLVIDDGSRDAGAATVTDLRVRIVTHEKCLGRGAARQRAMSEARHELVLSCDAGLELAAGFSAQALTWFNESQVAAVWGRVGIAPAVCTADRWRNRHLFKLSTSLPLHRRSALHTGGCVLRRSATAAVGGFNPACLAAEDADLGLRLLAAGHEVVFDPKLAVAALTSDTIASALERYARWNLPSDRPLTLGEYARHVWYSWRVLAALDLRDGDPRAAAISLLCPHHGMWHSRRTARTTSPAS